MLAHGPVPAEAPTIPSLLLGWTFEPLPTLAHRRRDDWWLWAVRRVDSLHPANPVPRSRTIAFLAAMTALAFALVSGIGRYDTSLFSIHMVQHVLLMLVAAPLIALSAPITLILRLSSPSTRRRWILPFLNSRPVRFLAFPVTDWIVFAGVMWASHFSALFNAALEDPLIHDFEHGLFLTSALLFWWPAVGLDPAPWRVGHPVRIVHVFMQMTQNTFLAVVILNVPTVLYAHYATLVRAVGAQPDRRSAPGRRDHVARRRPHLPDRDHGPRRRLDAGRRTDARPEPTARPRSTWPRSVSASGAWPSVSPTSAATRAPDLGLAPRSAGIGDASSSR